MALCCSVSIINFEHVTDDFRGNRSYLFAEICLILVAKFKGDLLPELKSMCIFRPRDTFALSYVWEPFCLSVHLTYPSKNCLLVFFPEFLFILLHRNCFNVVSKFFLSISLRIGRSRRLLFRYVLNHCQTSKIELFAKTTA